MSSPKHCYFQRVFVFPKPQYLLWVCIFPSVLVARWLIGGINIVRLYQRCIFFYFWGVTQNAFRGYICSYLFHPSSNDELLCKTIYEASSDGETFAFLLFWCLFCTSLVKLQTLVCFQLLFCQLSYLKNILGAFGMRLVSSLPNPGDRFCRLFLIPHWPSLSTLPVFCPNTAILSQIQN